MKYIFLVYYHDNDYPYHNMITDKTQVFANFDNAQEYCDKLNGTRGRAYHIKMFEVNPAKTGELPACQAYD